ncbi:MAG: carboxymuconolactone decarboxylase family protein [Candidatus Acidiferrales bacterium]
MSQKFLAVLLLVGTSAAVGYGQSNMPPQAASTGGSSGTSASAFPKDVYPETGNRLPPIQRDELDEAGKKIYDNSEAGEFGPRPIRLYSPQVAADMTDVNVYLRHDSGLDNRLVELTILVAAREMDAQFEWTFHEPVARKAGVPQSTIDVIKYRKPLQGPSEEDATVIQLGREAFEKHQVSSATAARALKLFGKPGFVNIVSLMGDYAANAILMSAFDQHLRPGDKPLLPIP